MDKTVQASFGRKVCLEDNLLPDPFIDAPQVKELSVHQGFCDQLPEKFC